MNLKQFLEYRTHCPYCSKELISAFCSKSRPIISNGNTFTTSIKLRSLKRGQKTYEAKLSIQDKKFVVEFERTGESLYDKIPLFVLDRFKDFIHNSRCTIFKHCKCENYTYHSNYFHLDLKSPTLQDLSVNQEYFSALRLNKQTVCNISSFPKENRTTLQLYKYPIEENNISGPRQIDLPFIKFMNQTKMIERLNKLLVFS